MISIHSIDENIVYDGTQIRALWGFEKTGIMGDSIISFAGPMKVALDEMIDQKDVLKEKDKTNTPISSDLTLHFIIEHFDTHSPKIAFLRQRILLFTTFEILKQQVTNPAALKREFSDIYYDTMKLTVSIASAAPTCIKIHLGINILSTGAPDYVKIIGLRDIGVLDYKKLAKEISMSYKDEILRVEEDICKIRPL